MELTIIRALQMYGIAAVIAFLVALLIKGMYAGILLLKKPSKSERDNDDIDQLGLG
jgi:hypothetical protein